MKKIWVVTLFPELIKHSLSKGVIGRYFEKNSQTLNIINPSDYNSKGFKGVDSPPYGGGPGVIMRADILANCFNEGILRNYKCRDDLRVILPTPRGSRWSNIEAKRIISLYEHKDLVFICGRYEGIDERFIQKYVDLEYSIGDYVLSGGELATCVMIDSFMRFKKNVLGNEVSVNQDSFEDSLLDSPKFTRPRTFEGLSVPDVLMSGDHAKIHEYNERERISETKKYRPDIMKIYGGMD